MRIGTDKFHKGVKEKTLLLWPEFSCRPAHPIEQDCSGLPFRELGTLRDSCSAFGFLYQRFSSLLHDEANPF